MLGYLRFVSCSSYRSQHSDEVDATLQALPVTAGDERESNNISLGCPISELLEYRRDVFAPRWEGASLQR
jgi:predicted secreted protein